MFSIDLPQSCLLFIEIYLTIRLFCEFKSEKLGNNIEVDPNNS